MEIKVKNKRIESMFAETMILSAVLLLFQVFAKQDTKMTVLIRLLYYMVLPSLMFCIGYGARLWQREGCLKEKMLKLAAWFYGIYVAAGTGRFFVVSGRNLFDSIIRTATGISLPRTAQIWAMMTALCLVSIILVPFLEKHSRYKKLYMACSLALIAVILIPAKMIGYSFIGIFIGSEEFASIPMLAYAVFYMAGFLADDFSEREKKTVGILVCLLAVSVLVMKHHYFLYSEVTMCSWWDIVIAMGVLVFMLWINGFEVIQKLAEVLIPDKMVFTLSMVGALYVIYWISPAEHTLGLKIVVTLALDIFVLIWIFYRLIMSRRRQRAMYPEKNSEQMTAKKFYILYTLGFFLLSFIIFLPFVENNLSFIWKRDGISQYYPIGYYVAHYVKDMMSGLAQGNFELKMYDFSIGLGDRVSYLMNPAYWPFALFGTKNAETVYQLLTYVRFYLSGISVSLMLFYLKKDRFFSLMSSFAYVFCGYAMYACLRHPQFSFPMILMPLLIVAVEEILRKRNWYLGCLLIAFSMISNYYFLYINSVVLVIYFLVRFVNMEKEKRTLKQFGQYFITFLWAYVLGVGMGFSTVASGLSSYATSSRSETVGLMLDEVLNYNPDWIQALYISFICPSFNSGYWMKLGFIPLMLIAVTILCLRRKQHKEQFVLFIIAVIAMAFPVFGYVLSGFSTVTNRWVYVVALLMAVILTDALTEIRTLNKREIKIIFWSLAPYFAFAMLYSDYNETAEARTLVMLIISYVVVLIMTDLVMTLPEKKKRVLLTVLVMGSLCINGDMFFAADGKGIAMDYIEKGEAKKKATAGHQKAYKEIKDDSQFFRFAAWSNSTLKLSGSLVMGDYGIVAYNSTYSGYIKEFLGSLGVADYNSVYYSGFNRRAFLDELAGVKYYGLKAEGLSGQQLFNYDLTTHLKDEPNEDYIVYENMNPLPLGYTYDIVMKRSDFEQYTALEKQEILMQQVIVDDDTVLSGSYETEDPELTGYVIPVKDMQIENLPEQDEDMEPGMIRVDNNTSITFKVDAGPDSELYIYAKGRIIKQDEDDDYVEVTIDNGDYKYKTEIWREGGVYTLDHEAYAFNCGYSKDGYDEVTLNFSEDAVFDIEELNLYVQPMKHFNSYINARKKDMMMNTQIGTNLVSGQILCEKPEMLVLSIPYQKGWTAYVDGKKADLKKVNLMYMGMELDKGFHSIELHYSFPLLKECMLVALVCWIIFFGCIIIGCRRNKRRGEK